MSIVCFVSYEIHPTTMGGCGVLLHHAAQALLGREHEVVFLLDVPQPDFQRFLDRDHGSLARPDRCRAYRVDDLCASFPHVPGDIPCLFQWKSLRFAHALERLLERERLDVVEFFEYCGPGYYAMARRLFAADDGGPHIIARLHGSLEVLHRFGGAGRVDRDRSLLYGLEHRALDLAETILTPSRTYAEGYYYPLYHLDPARVVVSPPPKEPFPRVTRRPDQREPFTIAFVGRLARVKGVDQLVRAAVRLLKRRPELPCTVDLMGFDSDEDTYGTPYSSYLRTLVPRDLQDRFRFAGSVPHAEVAKRLASALFAVFPNRVESFCYALHEVYDAGVPVIVNDLPSFADFFRHGENALVYDGTTDGLLAAMERLTDDGALRERLCRPYPVAEVALGDFYERPHPRPSVAPPPPRLRSVVMVLDTASGSDAALASLRSQSVRDFEVVHLLSGKPDARETLWWLGSPWDARDATGHPVAAADLTTADALLVLRGGDRLDASWLERATRALVRCPRLAFAGTWLRRAGRVVPGTLDLAPELHPFEQGAAPARVLMRTDRGRSLADLFDPDLGNLGEIGHLWVAVGRFGSGCLLPEPLLEAADEGDSPLDVEALKSLVFRYGPSLGDRINLLAGVLVDALGMHGPPARSLPGVLLPTAADAWRMRAESVADQLGGRVLTRMALRRLARRLKRNP